MRFNGVRVNSFLFFCTILCFIKAEDTDVIEFCDEHRSSRGLILVSTLDGRLSALSIHNGGQEKWSIPTEPGPLLSSTIHIREVSEDSHKIKIIPSLSGGLYKFIDGESIEPLPINTDNLLKSYTDGLDISGGKEIRSYAIDIDTGSVLYECSMNECSNWTETTYLNSDLILLRRETQRVRAIDMISRTERWNYSVGLHNVTITHHGNPQCHNTNDPMVVVKAVVPKGLLYVVNKDDPQKIEWKYQFESPIVNAWTLIGSRLTWIDLFKTKGSVVKKDKTFIHPTLYIGNHNEQLYIQESEPLHRAQLLFDKPRLSMHRYQLMPVLDMHDVVPLLTDESERNSSTALAMLYDGTEFVKGQGYYLHCPESLGDCQSQPTRGKLAVFSALFLSSVYYWKEAIILLSITFLLIHYLIPCPNITVFGFGEVVKGVFQRFRAPQFSMTEEVEAMNPSREEESPNSSSYCRTVSVSETNSYRSRYLEDFEPIHCLGRGGFGVVFQARNKMDDCQYAVKRITLPNREEARERVMREVKALAKLEHQHIVRYFQAWQECPPVGWQEEQDKLWKDKTTEEFLSSELESSTSHFTNCDNRNLGMNASVNRLLNEESDSLSIQFIDADYDRSGKERSIVTTNTNKVHTQLTSTASDDDVLETYKRRKSVSRSARTNRVYLYIQMQLCREHSLREWLCDNLDRDQNDVLKMFDQIVSAVEYVHLQGLIHRDLKPSNIFFSPDGQIKVGDFGLVTEITEDNDLANEPKQKSFDDVSRTLNVGTEFYMSPEQIEGKSYNYKVDIYSLGIILFELLTPFSTQMERHRTLTALRENNFPGDFHMKHKDEFKLLALMLSASPEKRPTTFGIKANSPFNRFRSPDAPSIPETLHFDLSTLPYKNNSNIIRKPSTEDV